MLHHHDLGTISSLVIALARRKDVETQKLFLGSSDDICWLSTLRLASSETVHTDQMLFFSLEVDFIHPDLWCNTLLDSIDWDCCVVGTRNKAMKLRQSGHFGDVSHIGFPRTDGPHLLSAFSCPRYTINILFRVVS